MSEQVTEQVPNILPHLQDLQKVWREQDFTFTKDQKEQYELLLQTRRERVSQFYAEDRVFKGPYIPKEKRQEDQNP